MRLVPETAECCSSLQPFKANASQSVPAQDVVVRRRRGAPAGNRNAWRHGRYGSAAREVRAAQRNVILREIAGARESFPANKRNNSVAGCRPAEPQSEKKFCTNKRNNSVAISPLCKQAPARKPGAPRGNNNALKHGHRSAAMRSFRTELRHFICEVCADLAWAKTIFRVRRNGLHYPDEFLEAPLVRFLAPSPRKAEAIAGSGEWRLEAQSLRRRDRIAGREGIGQRTGP